MVTNTLSIFLPGLLRLPAEGAPGVAAPALAQLLARARRLPLPGQGLRAGLAVLAGLDPQAGGTLPLAALAAVGDGLDVATDHDVLCADPVHLRVDMDRILLLPPEQLELETGELVALADAVRGIVSDAGGTIEISASERCYVRGLDTRGVSFTDLDGAAGRDIFAFMPAGDGRARAFRALLNAIQMSVHAHPVNEARGKRGVLEANALWLWGSGRLADIAGRPAVPDVWANVPWARGLAVHSGAQARPLPESLREVMDAAGSCALVVIDDPGRRAAAADHAGWKTEVERVDSNWIGPALAALVRGRFAKLRIVAGDAHVYTLTRLSALHFWRRARVLTEHLR